MEHPYGTIKRQWGFNYILTKKGINRASADVGFIMTAYNFRRIINIVGLKTLKEYLETVVSFILEIMPLLKLKLSDISDFENKLKNKKTVLYKSLKQLYLIRKLTVETSF